MKKLTCKIQVGNYIYNGVVDCNIESSYETLTDTCKITFPRKVEMRDKKITDLLQKGDKVIVNLGYDNILITEFTGFVKSIKASVPIEINCEDEMFLLKSNPITKSYPKITLNQLLKEILPNNIKYECVEFQFSNFRISNATPAEVLDTLKNEFALPSFFRNGILKVGLNVWTNDSVNHKFRFQRDIIDQNSLEFNSADDTKIKIVAISIDDQNKRTISETGDKDGEQRTFYYYNISKKELETIANTELNKLKFSGYRGSFQTFGEPSVKHGDTITLYDAYYPEREGTYIVKSVQKTFGINGFRQTINLDRLK